MEDLHRGAVKLLDGGTGTELQRRGVEMTSQAWCGGAALDNLAIWKQSIATTSRLAPTSLRPTHMRASRLLLDLDGLGDRFERINRETVRARIVPTRLRPVGRAGRRIAVTPRPLGRGHGDPRHRRRGVGGRSGGFRLGTRASAPRRGVRPDSPRDDVSSAGMRPVLAAAAETGLPIWAGLSARRHPDGNILASARRKMCLSRKWSPF